MSVYTLHSPLNSLDGLSTPHIMVGVALVLVFGLVASIVVLSLQKSKLDWNKGFLSYIQFAYSCFIKPHERDSEGEAGQQHALESFYRAQASVYDATRKKLLCGREDMLALLAAQLKYRQSQHQVSKPVWVDIGGGTGYNIEAMKAFLPVDEFFSHVYLVDLSPSLLEVARQRFERLGWKNVSVICRDAREFRLPGANGAANGGADIVTMSYSLSMIPDYYSGVDSLNNLMKSDAILGVVDFYVQNIVDVSCRNYTGGVFNRHVNWLGRAFWRAWFDFDRVNLDAARRDYLEYKFGTIISA
ncbi:hypothetical protein F66182_11829, partial [Fusarium sp. NRRL 66182]